MNLKLILKILTTKAELLKHFRDKNEITCIKLLSKLKVVSKICDEKIWNLILSINFHHQLIPFKQMIQKAIGKLVLLFATVLLGANCQGYFTLNSNNCPPNYYYANEQYVCWPCPYECLFCINPTVCTACKDGRDPYYGQCIVEELVPVPIPVNPIPLAPAPAPITPAPITPAQTPNCGEKNYYDSFAQLCLPCSHICGNCFERSSYCTSCPPYAFLMSGKCIFNPANAGQIPVSPPTQSCNPKFYYDSQSGGCLFCSSLCATCLGKASYCTSCSGNTVLASGGNCVYNPANGGQMGPFGPILTGSN